MKTLFSITALAAAFGVGVYIGTKIAKPDVALHNEDPNTIRLMVGRRFFYYDIPTQTLKQLFDLTPTF